MLLGYFGKHSQFVGVMLASAGVYCGNSFHAVIGQYHRQAMEIALKAHEVSEIRERVEELKFVRDLALAQLKDEGRLDMDKFQKELKAGSKILQWIPLGLIRMMMTAPHTKQEIKKLGIKQSENHVASRTVDGDPVKENQVIDETGSECNK